MNVRFERASEETWKKPKNPGFLSRAQVSQNIKFGLFTSREMRLSQQIVVQRD